MPSTPFIPQDILHSSSSLVPLKSLLHSRYINLTVILIPQKFLVHFKIPQESWVFLLAHLFIQPLHLWVFWLAYSARCVFPSLGGHISLSSSIALPSLSINIGLLILVNSWVKNYPKIWRTIPNFGKSVRILKISPNSEKSIQIW